MSSAAYVGAALFALAFLSIALAWLFGRAQRERGKVEGEAGTRDRVSGNVEAASKVASEVRGASGDDVRRKLRERWSRG